MSFFHSTEWNNFVRACRRQPWHVPKYGFQIAYLALRRISNKMRHRLTGDNHRGAKVRPAWLDNQRLDLAGKESEPLSFPKFATRGAQGLNRTLTRTSPGRNHDDPEWYFARNRWGACVSAILDGDRPAAIAVHAALDWIDQSLPKSDPAWEPYSSCERVVNLAVLLSARPACRIGIDDRVVRRFFVDSLEWIEGHLEYYGLKRTNNHILNNARALVVVGTVLRSTAAVERGLAIFARMAPVLFQHDGFLRERSSHYQVVVTNWILDAAYFARCTQITCDAALVDLAELEGLAKRAAQSTSLIVNFLGEANTHVGDISPDIHPLLALERLRYLYPAAITPPAACHAGQRDDWIFISRNDHTLVACVVPHSNPIKYTTHGHSDLGSFVWLVGGKPVLVDAGRLRYTNDAQSLFQAAPTGHNTVLINGLGPLAESLLLNGRWYPEPYSSATVSVTADSHVGFTLSHNGFRRLGCVGEHVRSVCLEGGGIAVTDRIEGTGIVQLETLWHFPPNFAPISNDQADIAGSGMVISTTSKALEGQIPDHNWETYPFSVAYGDEQPAPMLRQVWSVSLPCSIRTVLSVSPCAA